MLDLDAWLASGERVPITLPARPARAPQTRHIFCRVAGAGPWLTFLHGFPTCSWDWAKVVDDLAPHFRLLLFDFLGFGDSDKPRGHAYSLFEQSDITAALWRHFGVGETGLVAHDMGDTVALELLARQREGRLAAHVTSALLLNGGVYVDLYHPLPVQTLLQRPVLGAALARFISEPAFARRLSATFSERYPIAPAELHQHWQAICRRDGARNYHRLIRYIGERRRHRVRWEAALEHPGVPVRFVWGLRDPVSGAQIIRHLRERAPDASIAELADVGHYPQIEVPQIISHEILTSFVGVT
jgi:pimeloyl-ACP methyl ester carboxylesterase